jgi:biotin operon repressor
MDYCRSSIEKDIQMLRDEFDCPIERGAQKRLVILDEYSYTDKIIQWIEFYN